MKRLNKEYNLDICNHITVKYGSVNKEDPQIIYVTGRCWVSPNVEGNYEQLISSIEKEMRKNIKMFLMDGVNFDKKFILDFDLNSDKFKMGDKRFLSFDFYLKQNDQNKKSLKEIKRILNGKVSTIVNNVVYLFKENNFTIEKRK